MATKTIVIYYDETTDPANAGWVTRCTERDERGQPILGRIAMDVQLDARTADEAQAEAARHWGCTVDEVARYDRPV
jgi:hypothetical protein